MSAQTAHPVSSTGTRTIEPGRFDRAVTTPMAVERECDRLYRVTTESGTYDVDIENGSCTCPDATYRGDQYVCKHAIRASLVEIFATGVTTKLVARVAAHSRTIEHPCPHGQDNLCDGPTGPRLPCPGCCNSVRSPGVDEWTVWTLAVTEER